jgi:uracil-DNA glycosylase family 4
MPKVRFSMQADKRLKVLDALTRDWGDCRRCPLGAAAYRHVLYELPEGETRADVLFIGEAPGVSEDTIGKPFKGRAGRFLRETIEAAGPDGLTVAFSNLLACRPRGEDGKDRPPAAPEVEACHGRLVILIQTLEPWFIVGLGRVPEAFHPSYINREGGKESSLYPGYEEGFKAVFKAARRLKKASENLTLTTPQDTYEKFPGRDRRRPCLR